MLISTFIGGFTVHLGVSQIYEIGLKTIQNSLCGSLKPARNANQLVISAVTHAPFWADRGPRVFYAALYFFAHHHSSLQVSDGDLSDLRVKGRMWIPYSRYPGFPTPEGPY